MPRCRKCGEPMRSCKGLEQHWKENHPKQYQERLSDHKQNSRRLQLTNLIEYWKRKNHEKAPGHADQRQAQGQTSRNSTRGKTK